MTTYEARKNPFELLVALDKHGEASGNLFVDDGESVSLRNSVYVAFKATKNSVSFNVVSTGKLDKKYVTPVKTIYVLGVEKAPRLVKIGGGKICKYHYDVQSKKLAITPTDFVYTTGKAEITWV